MSFLIVVCFSLILLFSCLFVAYFGKNWNLKPLAALGSGALLSICFLDFMPFAFENDSHERTAFFILFGVLTQGLADIYLLPRLDFLDRLLKTEKANLIHEHSHTFSSGSVCSVTGCLSICSFFDGIRLFASLSIEKFVAFATAFGLFFHLLSEGILLAVLALSSGIKRRILLVFICCLTGALILGALFAQVFSISLSSSRLIAFSSGILIYVCFVHLLPFCLKANRRLWFFSGLILFSLIHIFI